MLRWWSNGQLDPIKTGDTICNGKTAPISLVAVTPTQGVLSISIAANDRKDDVRLSDALRKMAEEDPSLTVTQDHETGETVMHGQGEMHLLNAIEHMAKLGSPFEYVMGTTRVADFALDGRRRTLTVVRAWKRQPDGTYRIGEPKTRRGRRTLPLSPKVAALLRAHVKGRPLEALVFPAREGGHTVSRSLDAAATLSVVLADEAAFKKRIEEGRGRLTLIANEVARLAGTILAEYGAAVRKVKDTKIQPEATADAQ